MNLSKYHVCVHRERAEKDMRLSGIIKGEYAGTLAETLNQYHWFLTRCACQKYLHEISETLIPSGYFIIFLEFEDRFLAL
jgi:hypothetical protein